ncbi:MAG: hypothetical protein ACR2MT_08365 [Aurantibacter sp.]
MEKNTDFEGALMAHLSDCKLDEDTLKKYSAIVAGLRKQDILIDRVWKYGQPDPDGIMVRGRLGMKDLSKLSGAFKYPEIHGVEIFPLGIPFPELLDVRFKLGEQIEV